jgi:hypothetical protein
VSVCDFSRRTLVKLTCPCPVVVSTLQSLGYNKSYEMSTQGFREPPSLAEWTNTARNPISMPRKSWTPMDRFIAAVKLSVHTASPLESSTPSGCWLSALIEMQLVSTATSRDEVHEKPNKNTLTSLSMLHCSLESERSDIIRIEERIVDLRRSDYALAFSRVEELLGEVLYEKTLLEETLKNRFQTTSIQDARNAISCESPNPPNLLSGIRRC